jgi:hypothetical protein
MTPRAWYESRRAEWSRRSAAATARSLTISRLRLATFFGAVALIWWGVRAGSPIAIALAAVAGAAFVALIVRHSRLLNEIEYADAARVAAERGVARIDRDWSVLPEIQPPPGFDLDTHPYARDLDVFGHASLTAWLGPAATAFGGATVLRWLLAPAEPGEIAGRQAAIAELADRREWREALAAEGLRGRPATVSLERFLDWAERGVPAIPPALAPLSILLTVSIWLLIALHAAGLTDAWWMPPMLAGIVLSFAFARSMHAVFDRASVGERALDRYAAMLALACAERWSAPELERLQADLREGGDAPVALTRLSRLVEWSELRTAAAVLHFLIQALTLWDFHVCFAIMRWRRAHGVRVRAWLSALGTIDALAVLSAVRHDYPEWATPQVGAASPTLTATALGHPLIRDDRRVANDVVVGPPGTILLITGSNMSGKSTLLRAVGLNAVLAHAGAPVCAAAFSMPPCELQTSIRVQDSLELGLSYFMAALARLKAIVDAAERTRSGGRHLLYLLDEVLQGTNSLERAIAVRAVARHLLDAGAIGAMTTHDLTVAAEEPFASHAAMVHFAEQVHDDGRMTFDYRLRPGLATSQNALRLMQLIGISPK